MKGDSVAEVLSYVQYNKEDLISRVRRSVEAALREKRITMAESGRFMKRYEEALEGYTYLGRSESEGRGSVPGVRPLSPSRSSVQRHEIRSEHPRQPDVRGVVSRQAGFERQPRHVGRVDVDPGDAGSRSVTASASAVRTARACSGCLRVFFQATLASSNFNSAGAATAAPSSRRDELAARAR